MTTTDDFVANVHTHVTQVENSCLLRLGQDMETVEWL